MLPERDRDRDLDPVLRQVLRTSSAVASSACPDAETMAAWQARALPASEIAAFERHAADCARCRAMLAAFVRADLGAPVAGASDAAVDAVPFWRRWRLNWVVPVAASATAFALYVATPSPTDDRVVAEESVARQTSDAARSNEVVAPLEKRREAEADAAVSSGPLAERRGRESETRDPAGAPAPSALSASTADGRPDARDRRAQVDADTTTDLKAAATARQVPAESSSPPSPSSAAGFAPVPAAPEPTAPARAVDASSPPAPSAGAASLADAPSLDRVPGAVRRERSADLNEQVSGARSGSAARMVPLSGSPAGLRFRIDGERLERSASGDTWSVVSLPAGVSATEITSGTSVGQAIWMVGRGGLVLRTPDGDRFTRVPSPASGDLASVTAEDARTATVVSSDGRRYTTTDGGVRWTAR